MSFRPTLNGDVLSPAEAEAGYLKYKKAWDDAGIPWNKKGSPHHLKLKSKWYAKHLPINMMIAAAMKYYGPKLAASITVESPLMQHLTRKSSTR